MSGDIQRAYEVFKSQNWGKMWIKNVELYSNSDVRLPNDLDEHLDDMLSRFSSSMRGWITCNAVILNRTPQGRGYWDCIGGIFRNWYTS